MPRERLCDRPVGSEHMSDRGSFWSTIPGVVTGAAGVLTAIVGLLTVSVQLGWLGGDGSGGGTTTSTSAAPGSSGSTVRGATTVPGSSGTGSPGGTGSASSGAGELTVDPASVDFSLIGSRQTTITVRNTGDTPLTVKAPTVGGSGAVHFVAGDVSCTRETLQPGRSCEVQVAFAPKSGGAVSAVAVIAANEVSRQTEVQLKGSTLLG